LAIAGKSIGEAFRLINGEGCVEKPVIKGETWLDRRYNRGVARNSNLEACNICCMCRLDLRGGNRLAGSQSQSYRAEAR
jgi:hypothetical protein